MPIYSMFDPTVILLVPAMIFTLYAQSKVNRTYRKFAAIGNQRGITGAQAARRVLDMNSLQNVKIEMTGGVLTDHYDPGAKVMRLSADVYHESTIAAVSIAAHESGHAIQHGAGYAFLSFRNGLAPVVSVVSHLSWPLLIIGLIMGGAGNALGTTVFDLGVIFFAAVVLFHLVTLPVELNASRRALEQLQLLGIVNAQEIGGAKKVLSAAAMTYVAALASAIMNLIRILLIRGRD